MATLLGEIDSLERLLADIRVFGLDLNSLEDIILFRADWKKKIEPIKERGKEKLLKEITESEQHFIDLEREYQNKIKEREELLGAEKERVNLEITRHSNFQSNIFKKLYSVYKLTFLIRRKKVLESDFDNEVKNPLKSHISALSSLKEKINFLKNNIDLVVTERTQSEINKIENAAAFLEQEKDLLAGAIGEKRAVDELKKLPDSYFVINNFRLKIHPALPRTKEDGGQDYIKSVQIDHIVIGPPGVYVIETKNWSDDSMGNPNLFSPISQLQRSSYALFVYLQASIKSGYLRAFIYNWGVGKISLRNILLTMDRRPDDEYPHIKVLTLKEINNYIIYFKPVYSEEQAKELSGYLSSGENYWERKRTYRRARGSYYGRF
ncbi:MAG: nuclease-related domain-containing protein [bacterium]|nr:nuclease-related domain-containing protein [bacterium]